jgi:phenylalanyl-tRNA synthetase beta chain
MKFSYSLLKKMVPGIPTKQKLADVLSVKSFEVENIKVDAMEIKIMPNRWADASSHWGMAKEAAAATGKRLVFSPKIIINQPKNKGLLDNIKVEDSDLCPRYMAYYVEIPKIGESPIWMRRVLNTCGLRPINAVVDILNYVMLEIGQPLHAFDASKIEGGLVVRSAKGDEIIETIDNQKIKLNKSTLVIADHKKILAIAGVKGGASSKIDKNTKAIIIESANFSSNSIYKTSKAIKLSTDASQRFGHGLSPELCKIGADRAAILLQEICKAKLVDSKDVYPKPQSRKILKFDLQKLQKVIGADIDLKTSLNILKSLEFRILPKGFIEVPAVRLDINIIEDLIEEVGRMYDLNRIPSKAPGVILAPSEIDKNFIVAEKAKNSLIQSGFSEVRNSTFVPDKSAGDIELENPLSDDKRYLRKNLTYHLRDNIKSNFRFTDNIKIFEIGKVFLNDYSEEYHLAMAIGVKSGNYIFRNLRGVVEDLLRSLGLTDYGFVPEGDKLRIESDHSVLGYLFSEQRNKTAFLEINFDKVIRLVEGEAEYLPISPYPSIVRDISFTVDETVKMNFILEAIANLKLQDLEDVDMIDYFMGGLVAPGKINLTLRLVFRSFKKTLSDEEANSLMVKIGSLLESQFNALIR